MWSGGSGPCSEARDAEASPVPHRQGPRGALCFTLSFGRARSPLGHLARAYLPSRHYRGLGEGDPAAVSESTAVTQGIRSSWAWAAAVGSGKMERQRGLGGPERRV